ncbi:hypothetical protein J6590_033990 [Homalodisca vitripennis]|nr:hypothetical protein J6590_033990 [Homalodisca vitripennis]
MTIVFVQLLELVPKIAVSSQHQAKTLQTDRKTDMLFKVIDLDQEEIMEMIETMACTEEEIENVVVVDSEMMKETEEVSVIVVITVEGFVMIEEGVSETREGVDLEKIGAVEVLEMIEGATEMVEVTVMNGEDMRTEGMIVDMMTEKVIMVAVAAAVAVRLGDEMKKTEMLDLLLKGVSCLSHKS